MRKIKWLNTYIGLWRVLPVFLFYRYNRFRGKCGQDLEKWAEVEPEVRSRSEFWRFAYIVSNRKE